MVGLRRPGGAFGQLECLTPPLLPTEQDKASALGLLTTDR